MGFEMFTVSNIRKATYRTGISGTWQSNVINYKGFKFSPLLMKDGVDLHLSMR